MSTDLERPPTAVPRAIEGASLAELVDRACRGDSDAFGRLFERYHGSIYALVLRQTRSPSLAEDLASETFFRALRGIETFTAEAAYFGPWLVRIAGSLVRDHLKSGRTRLEQTTDDMTMHESAIQGLDSRVIGLLNDESLDRSLRRLPVSQRRCLTLRFLQQRSINETARLLGCSDGAVKQLQLRGLRNLARLMRPARQDVTKRGSA
jgi:RNA polymerase sigma-70 factor (ECF subfamily)